MTNTTRNIIQPLRVECLLSALSVDHGIYINEEYLSGRGVQALLLALFDEVKSLKQRITILEEQQ